ncbi:hypothetical protein DFQ30_009920 [Apophysomyces sp. BC1015]|nr:hypothetical protein DFQ30_009920 [Apophysomyces sp. BC1015]
MQRLDIAEFPVTVLLKIVADLLNSILDTNDKISDPQHITHFHSRAVPNITVFAYLSRILKFAPFSNEVLLSILVYFDRIAKLKRTFTISSLNIHRLLITGIVVGSKLTSDVFYPNTRYAKVGGLPLCELNQLELEFLFLCNFDLHIRLEDLQAYGDQLLTHALTQQKTLVALTTTRPRLRMIDSDNSTSSSSTPRVTAQSTSSGVFPLTPPYSALEVEEPVPQTSERRSKRRRSLVHRQRYSPYSTRPTCLEGLVSSTHK